MGIKLQCILEMKVKIIKVFESKKKQFLFCDGKYFFNIVAKRKPKNDSEFTNKTKCMFESSRYSSMDFELRFNATLSRLYI